MMRTPGSHCCYRIPNGAFELGAIDSLAERGLEAMITDELTGKQFGERVLAILGHQLSMNPMPQIVFSGVLSDFWGKRKPLTVLGYGLGALSKRSSNCSSTRTRSPVTRSN